MCYQLLQKVGRRTNLLFTPTVSQSVSTTTKRQQRHKADRDKLSDVTDWKEVVLLVEIPHYWLWNFLSVGSSTLVTYCRISEQHSQASIIQPQCEQLQV